MKDFFEHAIIEIPPAQLKATNKIELEGLGEDTTVTEVHLQTNRLN